MRRNQGLDILRGIAILLVLGHHYPYIAVWWQVGWCGVDLFFVLSGFLISGLLFKVYEKEGSINLKRFWIRRAFKIYPAYYVLIGFTILALGTSRLPIPAKLWSDVLFLQSYTPHFWYHGWSLAVEEHFYLILPLLLLMMLKFSSNKNDPFKATVWVFAVLSLACIGIRAWEFSHGVAPMSIAEQTHCRIDSLFFGVLLGYLAYFRPSILASIPRYVLLAIGIIMVIPAFIGYGHFMLTIGFTMLYIGCGCFLLFMLRGNEHQNPISKLTGAIGKYSYSIYLWHVPVGSVMFYKAQVTGIEFFVYIVVAIGIGVLLSKIVEMPALALRDRLIISRSKPEAVSAPA